VRISADLQPLVIPEDILHQTLVRAAHAIGRFEPRREGALRAWLATIADNLIRDAEKRRRRERRAPAQDSPAGGTGQDSSLAPLVERIAAEQTSPSGRGQRHENMHRLRAALATLPAEHREVLQRYYLQGQTVDQIAQALGCTHGAVRGLCYRARKRLREQMGRSSLYFSE
jgi:RNA polymerase sigma-70 factor (ECF subfamily)